MKYQDYIRKWLAGVGDEISFWNSYMCNEGGFYFYDYHNMVSNTKPFELEKDIPKECYGMDYSFLDVGSGPFSRCGKETKLVNLDAIAVDPLAYAYKALREKYGIDNGIKLVNGFVELLSLLFAPNSFDMVHMSNSLDHCFSAVDGIYQLLNVCKIGGTIVLRHHENEAQNEKYNGLHQWNLSLENEENSFIIWRNHERINVCELFKEYADFELYKNLRSDDGWIFNKVIMKKKKDISLPDRDYYKDFLDIVFEELIQKDLRKVCENELSDDNYINRIRNIYHRFADCKNKVNDYVSLKKVIVYGYGKYGKNLCYLIESLNIDIDAIIDKKGHESGSNRVIQLEKYIPDKESDIVIVTVQDESIYRELEHIGVKKVVSIDDFLSMLESR